MIRGALTLAQVNFVFDEARYIVPHGLQLFLLM